MPAQVPEQSAGVETLVNALFARIRDPQTGPELRTMALNALMGLLGSDRVIGGSWGQTEWGSWGQTELIVITEAELTSKLFEVLTGIGLSP